MTMRTAAAGTVIGLLALAAATWAAPPAPTPSGTALDPGVANLVKDLGHPDYKTREKAGQALAARGEKVLPDLRRALAEATDPEVSRRLGVLVRRLDHDRLVSAKRVTLNLKGKTAKDAFTEIEKQTGYRVEFGGGGGPDTRHDFVMDGVPFWEAMDRVAGAVGMAASFDYGEDVRVFASGSVNPYVAYAGPFRFVATNMQANRSVQLSNITPGGTANRGGENIQLQFQIYSEPKNPMLTVGQAEVVSAVDEAGASLLMPKGNPNQAYYGGRTYYSGYPNGYRSHNQSSSVSLFRSDRSSTTVKSLRGKVGITLLAGTVPEVVVPDPVKVKNGKFAGRTVELDVEGVTEAGGNYTAVLTIRRVGGTQNDYSWAYNQWQKLELVDAKGLKYRANQQSFNGGGPNGGVAQVTLAFSPTGVRGQTAKPGPAAKLVFNEWVTVTHEVPFEFKDLPLP
jgi:hypothetical protein